MSFEDDGRYIVNLPLTGCHLVDMPDDRIDCSIYNKSICLRCPFLGRFATGEGMDEYSGLSHIICFIMGIIVIVVGLFGMFANILIMAILRRQNTGRGFDTMLVGLAGFDLICSLTCMVCAISAIMYFQNWDRGIVTLYLFWLGTHTALFARSGSSFQTVLITFERYLIVAFPVKTTHWFTVKRARIMTVVILFFAFLMAFPRYSSHYIGENIIGKNISRTRDLDHLIYSTSLEKFWYHDLKGFFDIIDFWAPLPLLLLFNGLVYLHIIRFTAKRKEMNMKQKKDIRAVKMFLPVVIVLFLCNIIPIYHNYNLVNLLVIRESYMGILISYVINSAANLPIYYYRGASFRKETKIYLFAKFPIMAKLLSPAEQGDVGGKTSGTAVTSANSTSRSNEQEMEDLD